MARRYQRPPLAALHLMQSRKRRASDPFWSLGIGHWSFLLTFGALAQRAQVFQGEDAGIVAIAPGDLVGVAADRRHGDGSQGLQFFRLEDSEGVGRLLALFATAGAGTVATQGFPGVDAAVAVAPLNDELVGALPPQGDRHECLWARPRHDALLPPAFGKMGTLFVLYEVRRGKKATAARPPSP